MNIMLFARVLAKTGIGKHIDFLSNRLQREGHNVIVLTGRKYFELKNADVDCVLFNVGTKNPILIKKNLVRLQKIIEENAIDIVHCHHRIASLYMQLLNKKCDCPYIYTLHSMSVPHSWLHRKLTFYGEKAIGVSLGVCNFLNEKLGVPKNKIATVLNGVDEKELTRLSETEKNKLKDNWGIEDDKIVFVMHSRIEPIKNHEIVVEAISKLKEENRKKIVVVCSGERQGKYYKKIKKKIKKYGLENNFRFIGWTETREALGIADFLLLPSLSEGCSLTILEAFFMKVPVISTKTGAFEELQYCTPIENHNKNTIIEVLDKVINEETEYKEIIEDAYNLAVQRFTAERMTDEILDIYKQVIG